MKQIGIIRKYLILIFIILNNFLYSFSQDTVAYRSCLVEEVNNNIWSYELDSFQYIFYEHFVVKNHFKGWWWLNDQKLFDIDTLYYEQIQNQFVDSLSLNFYSHIKIDSGFIHRKGSLTDGIIINNELAPISLDIIIFEGEYIDPNGCIMYTIFYWHPIFGVIKYMNSLDFKRKCSELDHVEMIGKTYCSLYLSKNAWQKLKAISNY